MKQILLVVGMAALAVGCASAPSNHAAGGACGDDVNCAISAAEAVVKKANSIGFAWRDSESMIKDAKEAAKAGDNKKALKLAAAAEQEGKLAYEQGSVQQNARPWQW